MLTNFNTILDYQLAYYEQRAEYLKAVSRLEELMGGAASGSGSTSGIIRRGATMKNFFLGLFLATVLVSGGYWIVSRQDAAQQPQAPRKAGQKYHCPMHPNYISDKPGDCPICGMKTGPDRGRSRSVSNTWGKPAPFAIAANAATQKRTILYYTDAMNPGSRYDKPGKAPDGMDLEPVYAEEKPGDDRPDSSRLRARTDRGGAGCN